MYIDRCPYMWHVRTNEGILLRFPNKSTTLIMKNAKSAVKIPVRAVGSFHVGSSMILGGWIVLSSSMQ
jgi:hypothetical protein